VPSFAPSLVVAPYFFMRSNTLREWLRVNIECGKDTRSIEKNMPVAVQVVLTKEILLNDEKRDYVAKAYRALKPDVFLLWVDDFRETDAGKEELNAFVDFIRQLGNAAPVVNLYGGFFSVSVARCLESVRLRAVAHGLEYAEDRSVLPVGGGFPVSKFYLPKLHTRMLVRDVFRVILGEGALADRSAFFKNICNCPECQKVIKKDVGADFQQAYHTVRIISYVAGDQVMVRDMPTPETRRHCVRHYMWCKETEYKAQSSPSQLAERLCKTAETYVEYLGLDKVAHLRAWAEVLRKQGSERS